MPEAAENKIDCLRGVGQKRAELFRKLGINTLGDLLRHYPRSYEDWSEVCTVADAPYGEKCCIKARITSPRKTDYIRKGLTIFRFTASDGTGDIKITVFNNKYLASDLEKGGEFLFRGKISGNLIAKEMVSPEVRKQQGYRLFCPIYPQTQGMTNRMIENAVEQAIKLCNITDDPLPFRIRERYGLCELNFALQNIHFPSSPDKLEAAQHRLAFEELLILQLGLQQMRTRSRSRNENRIIKNFTEEFFSFLPFSPTGAQRRAVKEALYDMSGKYPMTRLIQGDVGSGKTAVAAAIAYNAVKNGFQAAMMAPTELLAQQHYQSLLKLFEKSGISLALLTGSTPAAEKKKIKKRLADGETDFVIGTHALLQADVGFNRLGLVVTDEQHRFGVAQRAALTSKGNHPHMLVMSATPIPRTLAMIIYGDLDLSVLDELPPGRLPVKTYAVRSDKRKRVYNFIRSFIEQGRQAYIVCPMIDEDESGDLAAAQQYFESLSEKEFPEYRLGLLHGKMKPAEKEAVMTAFSQNKIQILISTTVIEVGVDVPNACVIVIENAERFGLSQLHQLRGRVGRGSAASSCILISDANNPEAVARLKVMTQTTDGFKIADEDLRLRGPGDFFGNRQHGLPELKIADLHNGGELIRQSQNAVKEILAADPELKLSENRALSSEIKKLFEQCEYSIS